MTIADHDLATEERIGRDALGDDAWEALIDRLNQQSITKRHDAYLDVAWDDPANAIDAEDPRWIPAAEGLLGETVWWDTLDDATRARLGLHLVAHRMRSGVVFESVLSRGLLAYAAGLDNGSSEFRYAYHEVIEESQHSLMFQEFVNRTGLETGPLPLRLRLGAQQVVKLATRFPELFFVFVLGGEDPIDHVQRQALREGAEHPLLERIMRIHVTEEARHLSFARHQLKRRIATLGRPKRAALAYTAPVVLALMADQMMGLPDHLVAEYDIPDEVVRSVRRDPQHEADVNASLNKVRRLLDECGLLTTGPRRLWSRLGLET
ncbi:MAG: diiron oxygenase [Acidimicrobiia bacterium]|nr:diiron oxygenase [Acidimicrobiia bacterium]